MLHFLLDGLHSGKDSFVQRVKVGSHIDKGLLQQACPGVNSIQLATRRKSVKDVEEANERQTKRYLCGDGDEIFVVPVDDVVELLLEAAAVLLKLLFDRFQ